MSDLCSESSEEEQADVEEISWKQAAGRLPIIQLLPRSKTCSGAGSPKVSPKDSPRSSPRNSPLLFRKLLMNRSINLQRRRFTLAHTPRYSVSLWGPDGEGNAVFLYHHSGSNMVLQLIFSSFFTFSNTTLILKLISV